MARDSSTKEIAALCAENTDKSATEIVALAKAQGLKTSSCRVAYHLARARKRGRAIPTQVSFGGDPPTAEQLLLAENQRLKSALAQQIAVTMSLMGN